MFDKLKQIKQLKELQASLKKERVEVERLGVQVIINGGLEVEEITINPSLSKEEQEKLLVDSINEAIKKIQVIAAQKMSGISGFGA
ncbi:MAG: YbaB/EbfC family nucleoid-associated protein [Candidatus Nealsonbacteria bacterium]|nr:YbaB/EbfC family nucleoid-associated protein [Candidatus Nealsonbacteria bacterium]